MGDRKAIPLPNSSYELIIICVNTSHPGNLGAICRTMLNYGYSKLRLVTPKCDPLDEEARNRAKHAGSILTDLDTFQSLKEAVKDCSVVVGTSGKREVGTKTSFRHFCFPWELSERFNDISGNFIVKCYPLLPEHIDIDENNNIVICIIWCIVYKMFRNLCIVYVATS